ncbi:MAG TPA: peptide-methionine (S)-S-oxide reductase MsrA [Mucilaginibacter sp.]|nr:peptide-methionine (S)-S-oxide reductase MsrA [Mucilaginibacter sp.]
MNKILIYLAATLLYCGCANGQANDFATVPQPKAGEKVATFGGGCFWSMSEAMSELKGVDKVVSGYAGGTTKNPTYEEVGTQQTGHAEVVQIYYDPKVISFQTLAEAFFFAHDPTELNRQGPDEGTDYRSIAFYRTPEEKAVLQDEIKKVNASKHYSGTIVTEVVPFKAFYPAEKYHQGYYRLHLNENPYLTSVSEPKVMKFRKAMKVDLKPEFQK